MGRASTQAPDNAIASGAFRTLQKKARSLRPDRLKTVESAEQVLGTRTPDIRAVAADVFAKAKDLPAPDIVALAKAMLALKTFETRQVAYELLGLHRAALRSLARDDLELLGRGIDNWTAVDVFAGQVAGPAWRAGQISDADVARWARSKDRWWRRCALVCTTALNQAARGGKGDAQRTLKLCKMLAGDHDDMISKALSWALRELIPHDPAAVQAFINENEGELRPHITREVCSKLSTGRKSPRREKCR
ncbi:DNA alkylation repair protein [Bradyrhizobium diazoefficiens]|uniref:DNA alkylation repair protein n=1 Tax=Bradyrhizobium diazoefficiens TaxID=1355477 RepID=UPI003595C48D